VPKLPFFVAATMSFIAAGLGATAGHAAEYRLDAGDQVRLKVLDWRSTMGDVHEWTGLTGDYRISGDGTVSLPLLYGLYNNFASAAWPKGLHPLAAGMIESFASGAIGLPLLAGDR